MDQATTAIMHKFDELVDEFYKACLHPTLVEEFILNDHQGCWPTVTNTAPAATDSNVLRVSIREYIVMLMTRMLFLKNESGEYERAVLAYMSGYSFTTRDQQEYALYHTVIDGIRKPVECMHCGMLLGFFF